MESLHNIALFDMDGSLVDYEGRLRADLAAMAMPDDPDISELWKAEKRHTQIAARMRAIKAQPGWWFNLKPIASGMRVFRAAGGLGFRRVVLTKGPSKHPDAWAEKVKWCRKHLGGPKVAQITIGESKDLTYGKFLFDDFPAYALQWLKFRPRGLVIMPETDYNRDFSHPQVLKWTGENWDEVYAAMKACYDRPVGEPLERD